MGNKHSVNLNGQVQKITANRDSKETAVNSRFSPIDKCDSENTVVHSRLSPTDKLAQLLDIKSSELPHGGLSADNQIGYTFGVTSFIFEKYIFKDYHTLSSNIFSYMLICSGRSKDAKVLPTKDLAKQLENLVGILTDENITKIYLQMFGNGDSIDYDQFRELLLTICKLVIARTELSVFHCCPYLEQTVGAILESSFCKKRVLRSSYLCSWIRQHCPNMLMMLHKLVVHELTTSYRFLNMENDKESPKIELNTPLIEKNSFCFNSDNESLLPISLVWLLSTTLPEIYLKKFLDTTKRFQFGVPLDLSYSSHWKLLYNSDKDGLGTNRFLHHVSNYRGPTLMFIRGELNIEVCIGTNQEWKESHLYWGNEDNIILQIYPAYRVLLKAPKLMYMNLSIRGYPYGIRVGNDPSNPIISINKEFTLVDVLKIPYRLMSIEVWGCGDEQTRTNQMNIKQWEVKEAEKARKVKLTSTEWSDHPDRYLLELAGRVAYSKDN